MPMTCESEVEKELAQPDGYKLALLALARHIDLLVAETPAAKQRACLQQSPIISGYNSPGAMSDTDRANYSCRSSMGSGWPMWF